MSKKSKRPIPVFRQPIIETHCHLDYLKEAPIEEILQRAHAAGIDRLITISVEPDNFDRVREIAAGHDEVYCTQGVHPHEAEKLDDDALDRIRRGLEDERVLAVGEIGLDYFYDNAPRDIQRKAFAKQLALAAESDRPIVVHTREAEADTMALLGEFAPQLKRKGVIHSFTSSPELGAFCTEAGFCLGFNGIITFNKADNVREVLAQTPVDRLLLETDSPFLTPVPYRGRENAPCYLPFVAEKMAEVKGLDVEDLLGAVRRNSERVFFSSA